MGTTEAELRRQAELDRARMGDTLEAIGDRLSPERMVERRKAAIGLRVSRVRDAVMGSPGYVEPATQRMRDQASDLASSATDAARDAAHRMQRAPEMVADQARGNPLAAGLVAFGVGLLVATAFPRTRAEQRLVQEARPELESAKQEMREAGRDVGARMKDHAQDMGEELAETAKQATTTVAEQTKASAGNVADEARGTHSTP